MRRFRLASPKEERRRALWPSIFAQAASAADDLCQRRQPPCDKSVDGSSRLRRTRTPPRGHPARRASTRAQHARASNFKDLGELPSARQAPRRPAHGGVVVS